MRSADVLRLLVLAAIWGGSFMLMRVLAPALGPTATAGLRLALGGAALLAYFRAIGFDARWRRDWRHHLIVGAVNSALPFWLYGFAALHLPAGYSAILNSSAPLFGALCAALWLGERLDRRRLIGIALGAAGVALVARTGARVADDPLLPLAVLACLAAAACYALAGVYIRRHAAGVPALAFAGCSQMLGGALLLPLLPLAPPPGPVTAGVVGNLLALALLCSAVAYLLYFRLLADLGPTRALTVTFLIPVFGMLWGALFLGEAITPAMLAGCALVIGGTTRVLRRG